MLPRFGMPAHLRVKSEKDFRRAYRAARDVFVAGERDVVFPHGTYQLRVQTGVLCALPP